MLRNGDWRSIARGSASLYVPTTRIRSAEIWRAVKCNSSSDELSAHCKFSSTSSSGRFAEKRARNCVKFHNNRARSSDGSPRTLFAVSGLSPLASAGKSCTSSAFPPRVSKDSVEGSNARNSGSNASAKTA